MLLLRCTKKLQTALGLKKSALVDPSEVTSLNSWHLNLIEIENHLCIIAANDKTLFNFIIADIPNLDAKQLADLFKSYLRCVLAEEGFDAEFLDALMNDFAEVQFANTNSKRILGSLNELSFMYCYHIEDCGSIHSHMLPDIIKNMNRVVMSLITKKPIDALLDLHGLVRIKTG